MMTDWAVFVFLGIGVVLSIISRDQYRKFKERTAVCAAIADALKDVPRQHEAGVNWFSARIMKNLEKAGWDPFEK